MMVKSRLGVLFCLVLGVSGCASHKVIETDAKFESSVAIKDKSNEIYMAGVDLANKGNIEGALKYFFDAEKLDPKNKAILRDISFANYQLGKFSTSLEYAEKILLLSEYDYFALMRKAFIYQDIGDYEKSVAAFGEVLRYSPDDYVALANIAQLEFDNKKYEKSMGYIERFEKSVLNIFSNELREQDRYELRNMKNGMAFIKNVIKQKL